MRITEISIQKNNPQRYNVFIDSEFRFSAELEDIVRLSLKTDMDIDEDKLQYIIERCEYTKAYQYALRIITIKDYSIHEMKNKLIRNGYSSDTIERIISKLHELGFLNDQKFQQQYCMDGIYLRKQGIHKIGYELKKKGFPQTEVVFTDEDMDAMYQNAAELARKKYISLEGKKDIRGKLFRYLASKGYDYDMIRKIIEKTCNGDENCQDEDMF